eukprot:8116341-Pyramimonas_sp.AAC.1
MLESTLFCNSARAEAARLLGKEAPRGRGGAPDARRVGHGHTACRIPPPALPSPRHPYGGPRLLA